MHDAVILVGGAGTRMRSLLGDLPKVLAPVAGRPFLDHLLDHLRIQGARRVVLATGFGSQAIRDHCGDGDAGLEIIHSTETAPLGTGGAVRLALDRIPTDPFWLLAGDSLLAADLEAMAAVHTERRAAGTVALTWVEDRARFGSVEWSPDGEVTSFIEKGASGPGWINAGLYLLSRRMFARLPCWPASLELDILPVWIGHGLYADPRPESWCDIGVPESYQAVRWDAQSAMPDLPVHRPDQVPRPWRAALVQRVPPS